MTVAILDRIISLAERDIYTLLITFPLLEGKYTVKAQAGGGDLVNGGTGPESEFERIYIKTKEKVYNRIAAKCYATDDVDDIFQNTYVAVYKALCRLEELPPDEDAFVMLIANRQLIKYYSAVRRLKERFVMKRTEDDTGDIPDESFTVEDSIIDRVAVEEIRAFLKRRPLVTQKVFFLYYRRGLTLPEIAGMLEMSLPSVKMHLYRTLEEIRRKYRGKET